MHKEKLVLGFENKSLNCLNIISDVTKVLFNSFFLINKLSLIDKDIHSSGLKVNIIITVRIIITK